MNNNFYKDLDTNFEQAYKLCSQNFSHEELISLLKNGNIPEKQIAALKFDFVKSETDAFALVSNLTGCDGKIREAVAQKIYALSLENNTAKICFSKLSPEIFANATIDINANICRYVIDTKELLKDYKPFIIDYSNYISNFSLAALDELDNFIFRDKKYVINKQLFKLYWCLESVKIIYDYINSETLDEILKRSALQEEYTIREKVAQIIVKYNSYAEMQNILKNDKNYYVRAVFKK